MHYCLMFLSKKLPTDGDIETALQPYRSEDYYSKADAGVSVEKPLFTWDWWQLGGRYAGRLKLRVDPHDQESEYQWMFYAKKPRAGRLFRSQLIERFLANQALRLFAEDELFLSMGWRDGYVYVDGAKIADLLNFEEQCTGCYIVLCDDGTAMVRDNEGFDDAVKALCEAKRDGYVTFIDIHD